MCYDISEQAIPAYGHETIIRTLELILGTSSEGRWYGGEFLAGPPHFFARLTIETENIFNAYLQHMDQLHHIGDETTTSAALERIRRSGEYVADGGTVNIIGRFWNSQTLHTQKPFKCFRECFLLHLPADKRFLLILPEKETAQ